jgi:hypothetical protein
MCFEFISEAAMEASNAASLNRRAFLSNPMLERSDRCTEVNEIFWQVCETKDTKGFADSTYELLGTAKNALQRIYVLHDLLHFSLSFFDATQLFL